MTLLPYSTNADGLTACCLRFTAEAVTPISMDEHKGSAIRGALFQAMRRFCARPPQEAADCAECFLRAACPVAELMVTTRPGEHRGQDAPRPYTIEPPMEPEKLRYETGETMSFGFTLLGKARELLPYPILAAASFEHTGLGQRRRQANGRFERGTAQLLHIDAYHPLTGEVQSVLQAGEQTVKVPQIPITHADVLALAETMADRQTLTLHFLSPLRLTDQERLVHELAFRPLFQRLLERLTLLFRHFAGQEPPYGARELIILAEKVQVVEDETRWVDLGSYSSRQHRTTPIGGLVGRAVFSATDWRPFLPWLIWGQIVHVGKDAVKGNGWYTLS